MFGKIAAKSRQIGNKIESQKKLNKNVERVFIFIFVYFILFQIVYSPFMNRPEAKIKQENHKKKRINNMLAYAQQRNIGRNSIDEIHIQIENSPTEKRNGRELKHHWHHELKNVCNSIDTRIAQNNTQRIQYIVPCAEHEAV